MKIRSIGLVGAVLIAVVAINSFQSTKARLAKATRGDSGTAMDEPHHDDQFYVNMAQWALKKRLKDPESATFSNISVTQHGDTVATCGDVNSKHSFGGFTGKKSFLVVGSLAATEDDLEPGVFSAIWNRVCVQ